MAPVTILFGVAGSIPRYLYFRACTSGWRDFVRDSQVLAMGVACLVTAGMFTVLLGVGDSHSWRQSRDAFRRGRACMEC